MTLRSACRLLARIIVWPLILVAVVYLLLLFINRHDRLPSAEAQRLEALYSARVPVADVDNGYVYLNGIGHVREHDSARPRSGESAAFEAVRSGCRAMDRACADLLSKNGAEMRSVVDADKWTLARYRELIQRRSWQGPMPIDVNNGLPRFVGAAVGQQLLLMDAWARARAGETGTVGASLAQDHRFWRMVLATSDDLLCKLYARAAVKRNLMWGNMILAQLPRSAQAAAVPAQWRQPVTLAERSLRLPMVGEYQFVKAMLDDMASEATRSEEPLAWQAYAAGAPLTQRQDTLNEWAAMMFRHTALLEVDYRDLAAAMARLRSLENAPSGLWSMSLIYNPIGRIMIRAETPRWSGYGDRLADLEGVRRAALLAVELRSAGVTADQVPGRLASAPLRNPYDGKPFGWDIGSKSITFTGLQMDEQGRNAFAY